MKLFSGIVEESNIQEFRPLLGWLTLVLQLTGTTPYLVQDGHVKLKKPKQLQEVVDIARGGLLAEIEQKRAHPETEEKKGKLKQLKSVLEM
ncbi:hypothetical protein Pmani_001259 [Petrolisthes manimaculis]|uniref:Uncharacterized protein n=1 Tax=Petrolisthes manimaculis TaxID=1843537 RepID=A0AAE1QKV4_9EUCA|nr:hypothetical protein Pmani_001259 [Petrolisthes manimaculis]